MLPQPLGQQRWPHKRTESKKARGGSGGCGAQGTAVSCKPVPGQGNYVGPAVGGEGERGGVGRNGGGWAEQGAQQLRIANQRRRRLPGQPGSPAAGTQGLPCARCGRATGASTARRPRRALGLGRGAESVGAGEDQGRWHTRRSRGSAARQLHARQHSPRRGRSRAAQHPAIVLSRHETRPRFAPGLGPRPPWRAVAPGPALVSLGRLRRQQGPRSPRLEGARGWLTAAGGLLAMRLRPLGLREQGRGWWPMEHRRNAAFLQSRAEKNSPRQFDDRLRPTPPRPLRDASPGAPRRAVHGLACRLQSASRTRSAPWGWAAARCGTSPERSQRAAR